jgi:hypothetical protein
VTRMSSTQQKTVDLSIQVYRHLLRIYPRGFLAQFGDQLLQTFGDLARRAMKSGGYVPLLLLWSRMVPDVVTSAMREHTGSISWAPISRFRLRWIAGCGLGFVIGSLVANQLRWWGATRSLWFFLCLGVALGWMQWVWALRRRTSEVLPWIAASAGGMMISSQAFVYGVDLPPRFSHTPSAEGAFYLAIGFGVGFLQFLLLRKAGAKPWGWIAANMFGFVAGRYATLALSALYVERFNSSMLYVGRDMLLRTVSHDHSIISPELLIVITPFLTGAILGYLTSIPLESVVRREDKESFVEVVPS